MKSEARAMMMARQELAGLDLSVVWPVLWLIAKDVGIYIGGGIVLGSTVGGVIGAFFRGAGAIPGVIGGAAVGGEIGSWLLGLIGIKCLIEHIGKTVPEMAEQYSRAFAFAWNAGELDLRWTMKVGQQMQSATLGFARGHLLLAVAILSAIVLYLARGALSKVKLYAELGQSKLGPQFAKWVEENEGKLVKHPALQPQKPITAAMLEETEREAPRASGSNAGRVERPPETASSRSAEEPVETPPPDEGLERPTTSDEKGTSEEQRSHEKTDANAADALFANRFPADALGRPNLVPLGKLSEINGTFDYVVTENGELVVGRISRFPGGGHIDLAGGLPVQAAGEVKVVDGAIKYIDNASGHYLPSGALTQTAAESAFAKLGFDTTGKYVTKVWRPDPSLPRGGAWRPAK
jgi:hypothetical protein